MIRTLGYYVLVVMMIICAIRLTNKEQVNHAKEINSLPTNTFNTVPLVTATPANPIPTTQPALVTINNTPTNDAGNNADTANTSSNVPYNPYDNCATPTEIKLIEETSIEQLKAQGWRLPKKSDYYPDYYSEIKKYYKSSLVADFDNNGLKDKAVLMIRDYNATYEMGEFEGKEQALFIILTQPQSSAKILYMTVGEGLLDSGIVLENPPSKESIEPSECKENWQSPAINFSYYEKCGGEIIFWDKEQGKFFSAFTGC